MPELWDHQQRGVSGVIAAIASGHRSVGLTSPTGGGKTAMMKELIRRDLAAGRRVSLYTNRRLLLEQTAAVFEADEFRPGIRAAGHHPEFDRPFQIHSVQTEHSRADDWDLHPADRVYIDEAHNMVNDTMMRLVLAHQKRPSCAVVWVTATPLNLGNVCDVLVQAGTTSELRSCGALVPAVHFSPSEPWVPKKQQAVLDRGEDLSEPQQVKAIMRKGIFGNVFDAWKLHNPEGKPTVLFAPGVKESLWFAEQFWERGVSAAHIDGDTVWQNGAGAKSSRDAREAVLADSKEGRCRVLCNRFVLREGWDAPWLAHGILACVFGSLSSYLQAGGRLLRAAPGKERVTVQDHGGHWHRFGSLNANRTWDLSLTAHMIAGIRADRLREKAEPEPYTCPQCRVVLARFVPGYRCPECGYVFGANFQKSRPVMMEDGSLKEMAGDIYKPKVRRDVPTAQKKWVATYFRARNSGTMTFKQAEALFVQENGYYPLKNLKFMPLATGPNAERNWYLRVADVPREELYT